MNKSVLKSEDFWMDFFFNKGGKGMKKILTLSMIACMMVGILTGCQGKNDVPKVSVAQIVEHKSLNEIRDSFHEEMKALGYKDGENIQLEFKDAGNQRNTLNSILSTFAGNQSDVIVAIATPTAIAAANYSEDIPIVFSAVSDPIQSGLIDDLQHPNKNITGTSDEIQVDKILSLALEMDPNMKKLGFIYNSGEANSVSNLEKAKVFCKEHNLTLIEASGTNISEMQSAFSVLLNKCDAIFAPNDNTVASSISALVELANKKKVPVYAGADSMVSDGCFATVGINYTELGKETARMVNQILKGKDVSEIPVKVFKDDLNIYVNEDTLQAIGRTIPKQLKEQVVMMK